MAARLEEAEQARARQLAAIAHELTRPLAGMRAAVETLHDGADADIVVREALYSGVEEEVARLERLIGTLQSLHQQGLRPIQLNRTNLLLERVIRASVAHFEPMAVQLGVSLAIEMPHNLPQIHADEDRLIQVLTNLLDNAHKFTPSGGMISLRVSAINEGILISVSDTGTGISDAAQAHIFDRFYQADPARGGGEKHGSGLGQGTGSLNALHVNARVAFKAIEADGRWWFTVSGTYHVDP